MPLDDVISDAVSATLQTYAERGVFRGFRAAAAGRRVEYSFTWLLERPMRAVFDTRDDVLKFPALFPAVEPGSPMTRALGAVVASRAVRAQPRHKRLDARRARVSCAVRGGDWSLAVHIRGTNHDYAVRKAVNLIHELFVLLQESYPDYLAERFGLSTE